MGLCALDLPRLDGLPPLSDLVTSDIAYVRFHGRNSETWWTGDSGSRYEYKYSQDELSGWIPRLESMTTLAAKTRVYFNNHRRGNAPKDAQELAHIAAAIEENLEGSFRGFPFVIASEAAPRAVVLDVSRLAHAEGIRRGIPLAYARDIVHGILIRAPRPDLYRLADEKLAGICRDYTPLVEPAGCGHVFLDLAGTSRLNGPAEDAAGKIRRRIRELIGLNPVFGLAGSKTASKVAPRVFRPGTGSLRTGGIPT